MNNSTSSTASPNSLQHIKQDLIHLCDIHTEFQHFCAFYCKSSSVLIRCCNLELDNDYAEGMARFAQMVLKKSQLVDEQLKQLLRKV
jgi:hypothetical protein